MSAALAITARVIEAPPEVFPMNSPTNKTPWVVVAVVLCGLVGLFVLIFPLFPIEQRVTSPGGSVRYTSQFLTRLDLMDWFDGLRHDTHSREHARWMIFGDPAIYVFMEEGHVYALLGNESGMPASVVEHWNWSGHPHDFPFYHDYDVGP